jgi:methylenetetrahydrofolate reductase (NADPH)
MKVIDMLRKGNGRQVSVEIEPPMLGKSIENVFKVLDPLVEAEIRYVNITYHTEHVVGYVEQNNERFPVSQRRKPGTVGIAGAIQARYASKGIEAVPHVICTGFTKHDVEEYLIDLGFLGIENVMALRGDAPKNPEGRKIPFARTPGGHSYANELIEQIANLRKGTYIGAKEGDPIDFCIGAACYPEGHPESRSPGEEFRWLKTKVDAGADYLVTQMFFDNEVYKRFIERARKLGIEIPIVPGIKPLASRRHLESLPSIFNCSLPEELRNVVKRQGNDEEKIRAVGVEWCVEQCRDLINYRVPGIHFYASRRSPIEDIVNRIL